MEWTQLWGQFKGNLVQKIFSELLEVLTYLFNTQDNQQPSQANPIKVVWKVQRLILEDGDQ